MEIKAKEVSKWSMIASSVWILLASIFKGIAPIFFNKTFDLTVWQIIAIGLALAVTVSPIALSIALDKIKDIKASDIIK